MIMTTATAIAAFLATAVIFDSFRINPKYTGKDTTGISSAEIKPPDPRQESTKPKSKKMVATSPRAMQQIALASIEQYTEQKAARDADKAAEALRLGKEDTTGSALAEVKPTERYALSLVDQDTKASEFALRTETASDLPNYAGRGIACESGHYVLGKRLAAGQQGGVYVVDGDKVAKVEHGPGWTMELPGGVRMHLPTDIAECDRARMAHRAGVRTPNCDGVCTLDPRPDIFGPWTPRSSVTPSLLQSLVFGQCPSLHTYTISPKNNSNDWDFQAACSDGNMLTGVLHLAADGSHEGEIGCSIFGRWIAGDQNKGFVHVTVRGDAMVFNFRKSTRDEWTDEEVVAFKKVCQDSDLCLATMMGQGSTCSTYGSWAISFLKGKIPDACGTASAMKTCCPKTCGLCQGDSFGGSVVMLFKKVPGDKLVESVRNSGVYRAGPGLQALRNADGSCSQEQKHISNQIFSQYFTMVKAGFANTDQHVDNMMVDADGKVWFIDFGMATCWAEKAKNNTEVYSVGNIRSRWEYTVRDMFMKVYLAVQSAKEADPCVDFNDPRAFKNPVLELPFFESKWFGEQLGSLDPQDRFSVCSVMVPSNDKCIGGKRDSSWFSLS